MVAFFSVRTAPLVFALSALLALGCGGSETESTGGSGGTAGSGGTGGTAGDGGSGGTGGTAGDGGAAGMGGGGSGGDGGAAGNGGGGAGGEAGTGGMGGGNAGALTVVNHSFEEPDVDTVDNAYDDDGTDRRCENFPSPYQCPLVPGWSFVGESHIGDPHPGVLFFDDEVDGEQVFQSRDTSFHPNLSGGLARQDLSAVYQAGTDYSLTVAVGHRADGVGVFGKGRITLYADGDVGRVVKSLDLASMEPTPGTFIDLTLSVSAAEVSAAGAVGQTIGILFGGAVGDPPDCTQPFVCSGSTWFDNVRLTASPAQ